MKPTLIIITAFTALLIVLSCVDDTFNHQYGIYESEIRIQSLNDEINEASEYQFNLYQDE